MGGPEVGISKTVFLNLDFLECWKLSKNSDDFFEIDPLQIWLHNITK